MEQSGQAGSSVNLGRSVSRGPSRATGRGCPQVHIKCVSPKRRLRRRRPTDTAIRAVGRVHAHGKVVAREVVTIVPASDIKAVAEQTPPPSGGYRAEVLKGNDYLRLWINRGGNHYLIHFNI